MSHDPAGPRAPQAPPSPGSVMAERRRARPGAAPTAVLAFGFGAVALWATNALVGKTLLASHPVSEVQFLQFCGAALVFALIRLGTASSPVAGEGGPARRAGTVLAAYAIGFLGLVGTMALQYIAFASMPVIEANLVAYTWPLMVAAAVIVAGRPKRPLLLGFTAALGFVGVALVIAGGHQQSWFEGSLFGYCAAFGSALCMAFYSLAVGRLAVPPDRLLLPSALIGAVLAFIWCLHDGAAALSGLDLVLGLYLGAGPMGLGYYFWSRALNLDRSGRLAVVAYLTPIASTLLLTLSGESLSRTAIAGAVLVIGSCIAVGIERPEAVDHA